MEASLRRQWPNTCSQILGWSLLRTWKTHPHFKLSVFGFKWPVFIAITRSVKKKFGADFWVSSLRCWSFRSRDEKQSCLRGVLLWICVGGWRIGSMKPAKTCKSVCLNRKITTVQVTNKPWTQQSLVSEVKLFFQTLKKSFFDFKNIFLAPGSEKVLIQLGTSVSVEFKLRGCDSLQVGQLKQH